MLVALLKGKSLSRIPLSRTPENLLDLRGFSAPKTYVSLKSNTGLLKTHVSDSIRIKDVNFLDVDLSFGDFESCLFIGCLFANSNFHQTRFFAANFFDCKFSNINAQKTNFGSAIFNKSPFYFSIDNFFEVKFFSSNFSNALFIKQKLINCTFTNCQTGAALFGKSELHQITFVGLVRNLQIQNPKKIAVDFSLANLDGLQFKGKNFEGIVIPASGKYFFCQNKKSELASLSLSGFNDDELKIAKVIVSAWSQINSDLLSIDWLDDSEKYVGLLLLDGLSGK